MNDIIKVIVLTANESIIIAKVKELTPQEIGEPDCLLIDPVKLMYDLEDEIPGFKRRYPKEVYDHHGEKIEDPTEPKLPDEYVYLMGRYISTHFVDNYEMAISSANILTMVDPSPTLLSEYLVFISD